MEIGIIGLPKSGKTTVFNALTRGQAETGAYSSSALTPNIGVVKVPDPRLGVLTELLKPKRTVPAEVTYIDIAAPAKGFGRPESPGGQLLSYLSNVDALAHVVRAFEDDRVPHVEGSVDPERDVDAMNLELAFWDLSIIERRLAKLKDSLKGARQQERDAIVREENLLAKIKAGLENDTPVREQELTEQESRAIRDFQLLTAKPMLLLLNIGEAQIPQGEEMESRPGNRYRKPYCELAALCGQIEMELTQLSEDDARDYRSASNMGESGLDRVISVSYSLLGLISFFTTASDEVKAWTIRRGTIAQKAAGKVHSDMERGYIRAEVVALQDLAGCGSMAEARKQGLLRLEGKNYVVKDGDVLTILFNV